MTDDNEAKVVMDGPCPHCGHIPLHEERGWIVCDGCLAKWKATEESIPEQGED